MTVTEDNPANGESLAHGPGIDPDRLAVCLSVLDELDKIDVDHPDAIAVRRATAGIYRTVKQRRRQERRASKTAHDRSVTEATATGSAERIDDETQGLLPSSSVAGRSRASSGAPAPATSARPATSRSTRSTTSSARPAPPRTAPAGTPVRTSRAAAPCSPAAGPRSACTSRCACCATAPTPPSPPASPPTRSAVSRRWRTATSGSTGSRSSASTCGTPPRSSRSPTPSPPRARWTS